MASAMATKCSKNLEAMSSYAGSLGGQFQRHGQHGRRSRRPSRPCRRPARDVRRRAAAWSGRRRRCCPGRESRRRRGCCPSTSLRLTHQVKLISSFWNARARKTRSRWPRGAGHLVNAPAGPGVHRRIDVAEGELVGRDLPVGMHVPFAQNRISLLLGELGIDLGERASCGTPGPRPRTRDIPTCRASRSRRG